MSRRSSTDRSFLRRLDDRALPVLQERLRSVGGFLSWPLRGLAALDANVADGRLAEAVHRNRQFVALAAALIAFAGSYVHMQELSTQDTTVADPGSPQPVGGDQDDPTTGATRSVGPEVGADTETYVAERAADLAAADDGVRVAVVSFSAYQTAEGVEQHLPDDVAVHEVQLRMPLEGSDPLLVPVEGDIAQAVGSTLAAEREKIASEEEEFRRLLESGTVTDPEFERFYESEVDRLSAARNLIDSGTATVFAVVVEAEVSRLREIQSSDGVRLVDLAPEGTAPDGTSFFGLLPDGGATIGFGALS